MSALWALFLFLLPFWEGSGSAFGLLVAHLLFLLAAFVTYGRAPGLRRSLVVPAAGLLAAATLSGLFAPYPYSSLLAIIDLAVMLGCLGLGEAVGRTRQGAAAGSKLDPALATCAAIALAGAVQALIVLAPWIARGFRKPGAGTLLNQDQTAAYLLLAFWCIVGLGFLAGSKSMRESRLARLLRSAALPAGALVMVASLLQASRGAFLAFAAGGALFVLLMRRELGPRQRKAILALGAVIVLAGAGALGYRLVTSHDPYRWERVRIWKAALAVAHDHWLIGCGPGQFAQFTAPYDPPHPERPVAHDKHVEATHSEPLRVLAETGLVGTLAFVALATMAGLLAIRALRTRDVMLSALAAAVAGLVVQAQFENLSARPAVSYTGAWILGLVISRAGFAARAGFATRALRAMPAQLTENVAPARSARFRAARAIIVYGGIVWAAGALVIAPYMGHRAFTNFRRGGPEVGRWYQSALRWNPLHPRYHAALAEAALAGGARQPSDLRAAFVAIDRAIALNPIDPALHIVRARLARAPLLAGVVEPDWARLASEEYRTAMRLDPLRPLAGVEFGWMELALGRTEQALELARGSIDSEPNFFDARRLRAAALVELGRHEDAIAERNEAMRRRKALGEFLPSGPYETDILRWDEAGWQAIEARLGGG